MFFNVMVVGMMTVSNHIGTSMVPWPENRNVDAE